MLTDKQREQLNKLLLLKLGSPEKPSVAYQELALDQAVQLVENYCSIDEIPTGLYQTVSDIARDYYQYYQAVYTSAHPKSSNTVDSIMQIDLKAVSEVKMGDTQIKLDGALLTDNSTIAQQAHSINVDTILETYKENLNEYRRLIW